MSFRVEYAASAMKALEGLPKKDQQRIVTKVDSLASDPHPPGSMKLQGADELWRVRVGVYRIVYSVDGGKLVVLVVRIGHRRDVYRRR